MPIICMVTAYGREDLIQQAEKFTLDAFLHKPVTPSLLLDTIVGLFGLQTHDRETLSLGSGAAKELVTPNLAGARVLLVEDNAINQEVAREWLESWGMEVTTADNGRAAVKTLCNDHSFDVILMDVQMPDMDGYEATRRIRQDQSLTQPPIIAMTAHALQSVRDKCLAAGMDDYVSKPIDPEVLIETLMKWVHPKEGASGRSVFTPVASESKKVLPEKIAGINLEAPFKRWPATKRHTKEY